MFLEEKFESPVIRFLRSDNLEFILSFFYYIFRNKDKWVDSIKQLKLEKELEIFIGIFNKKSSFEDKKLENAKNYIEFWIKNQYLRRIEVWDFDDDYNIELSDYSLLVMNFFDNLWIEEKYLHASVKSDFENAIANLKSIAFSSESFKDQNIKEIDKQIKELEQKKSLIESWDLRVFEEEVYDKYTSAKEILKKMPTSFRKVETVFENIYNSIQKKSNELSSNRWNILSFTLDEIDEKINNSSQWKSFIWFEKFYSKQPKQLLWALEKIFESFEIIKELEKEKSIKNLIEIDLLKSKKRAYNKKTFIVAKLREVFNEDTRLERKLWIDLIKNIKKYFVENNKKINYKNLIIDIDNWFLIDLFCGKNFWERKEWLKLMNYDLEKENQKEEIDIENIFRYTTISEKQLQDRIFELLKNNSEVKLEQIIEKYPVQYWVDEFMTYIKIAMSWKGTVKDWNKSSFHINWIHNNLFVESGEVEFGKK